MGDKPIWEQIGSSFVQHYYQLFDADRTQLGAIYIDASCLTWEGQQFQGKAAIVEKLTSLPFQKIQHSITAQDHQPTPDSCILSMVVGQLKLLLDSGSGKYYVAGQLHLLWQGFQHPDHYLDHPANVLIPTSTEIPICHQPKVQQLKIEPLLLSLSPGQGICDSTLRQAHSISVADEDPIMGFHQIFLLKNINDAWVCTNDMFRLALHNFG